MFFAARRLPLAGLAVELAGAHSVGMSSPIGVLLRSDVPPHWFQSPGLIVGIGSEPWHRR